MEDRFKAILTQPEQVVVQLNDQLDFLTNLSAAYNETTVLFYTNLDYSSEGRDQVSLVES